SVQDDGIVVMNVMTVASGRNADFDLRLTSNLDPLNGQYFYNGDPITLTFDPPACWMAPAPWIVGKEWSCDYNSTGYQGRRYQYHISGKLDGIEKVTVPAGTFEALKITLNFGSKWTYWYAPAVRNYVKSDTGNPLSSFE